LYGARPHPDEAFFQAQRRRGEKILGFVRNPGLGTRRFQQGFVYEVGCGAGGILDCFRAHGCRVRGIDLGTEYLDYGRRVHGLDLRVGSIFEDPLETAPDLVVYSHVLEHVLDPVAELRAVAEHLSPAGLLYVEVPGVAHLMQSYQRDLLLYLQSAHTYHFTLTTLRNVARQGGFELVHGNETIEALFCRSDLPRSEALWVDDYRCVRDFLDRLEQRRKFYPWSLLALRKRIEPVIARLLDRLGLRDRVRRWRERPRYPGP
jgi:SAM-dependent methyltransferase